MVKIIVDGIIINQQNYGEGKTAQASVAEDRNDDFLLIADDRNSCSNEWISDSGCSFLSYVS